MPVFKYRDPQTGEWINVAGGGGGAGESVDAYTKEETLSGKTKTAFGLGTDAVPDDALSAIKTLIDGANANANAKAKIATGSYTGTGTYGASNPNVLSFGFEPKLVFIQCANPNSDYALVTLCLCNPVTEAVTLFNSFGSNGAGNSYYGTRVVVSWSGNSCSFYTTAATSTNKHTLGQMNATNIKYNYIAIG